MNIFTIYYIVSTYVIVKYIVPEKRVSGFGRGIICAGKVDNTHYMYINFVYNHAGGE